MKVSNEANPGRVVPCNGTVVVTPVVESLPDVVAPLVVVVVPTFCAVVVVVAAPATVVVVVAAAVVVVTPKASLQK